jgi:hypothetical protein
MSIIMNNEKNGLPWILENYIDLVIDCHRGDVNYSFLDWMPIYWQRPFIHVSRIHRKIFSLYNQDIVAAIKQMIDEEFYVLCFMFCRYILY